MLTTPALRDSIAGIGIIGRGGANAVHQSRDKIMNREEIKQTAIEMAKSAGLINLSRRDLCDSVGIPDGSFPHVMGCNFNEFIEELNQEGHGVEAHPVVKKRAVPALRKGAILSAAIELAKEDNYLKVTRDLVAAKAGVSMGLVSRYFGTMQQLKRDIMRAAVKHEIPEIIAQGLANGDKHAKKASPELKAEAAKILANS